jgi:hypothetical protein
MNRRSALANGKKEQKQLKIYFGNENKIFRDIIISYQEPFGFMQPTKNANAIAIKKYLQLSFIWKLKRINFLLDNRTIS